MRPRHRFANEPDNRKQWQQRKNLLKQTNNGANFNRTHSILRTPINFIAYQFLLWNIRIPLSLTAIGATFRWDKERLHIGALVGALPRPYTATSFRARRAETKFSILIIIVFRSKVYFLPSISRAIIGEAPRHAILFYFLACSFSICIASVHIERRRRHGGVPMPSLRDTVGLCSMHLQIFPFIRAADAGRR